MPNAHGRKATAIVLVCLSVYTATARAAASSDAATIEEGKALAFDVKKGNCLACHVIAGGELPGNIGPALNNMRQRWPDKAKLRAQIADASLNNPETVMPPFGRNAILTDDELNKVVEFIYTR